MNMNEYEKITIQYIKLLMEMGGTSGEIWTRFNESAHLYLDVNKEESLSVSCIYDCHIGECYSNCQEVASDDPHRWSYYEGCAVLMLSGGSGIPVEHAWLVDSDGRVVDPTWTTIWDKYPSKCFEYYGMEVPLGFAIEKSMEGRMQQAVQLYLIEGIEKAKQGGLK